MESTSQQRMKTRIWFLFKKEKAQVYTFLSHPQILCKYFAITKFPAFLLIKTLCFSPSSTCCLNSIEPSLIRSVLFNYYYLKMFS